MNDFDYDVMQKKRIAASARHRVCGSKTRFVSLPSDHMTDAQLKRRNGPVSTYKLGEPMPWKGFKQLPDDLKRAYLEQLHTLYGATDNMLASMFGTSSLTIRHMRKSLGLLWRNTRIPRAEILARDAKWAAFCNGIIGGKPGETDMLPSDGAVAAGADDTQPEAPVPAAPEISLDSFGVSFVGTLTCESLSLAIQKLKAVGAGEGIYRIRIEASQMAASRIREGSEPAS